MGNNIKAIMRVTKMNIWELADSFDVSHLTLMCIVDGGDTGPGLRKAIIDRMIALDLCPECGAHTIPAGACVHCLCGWELCQ
jgi:hypothetical protein